MSQERLLSQRASVDINKIKLNPKNPRLGRVKGMTFDDKNTLSQTQIQASLQMISQDETDNVTDLNIVRDSYKATKASILKMGRISTPIIIQKLAEKDHEFEYIVLEGNNRLTIYKELHEDSQDIDNYDDNWKNIPCEIIEDPNPKFYHQIQLTAHIVPPKPWDPFARAKYLHFLKNDNNSQLEFEEILQTCGGESRKNFIKNEINAYEHMEKWRLSEQYSGSYDVQKFQYFFQYQIRKTRLEGIGITEEKFIELMSIPGKIQQARHVSRLHEIWNNPSDVKTAEEIKNTFINHNSSEALALLDTKKREKKDVNTSDILELCETLSNELDKFSQYSERLAIAQEIGSLETLQSTKDALENFIQGIEDIQEDL